MPWKPAENPLHASETCAMVSFRTPPNDGQTLQRLFCYGTLQLPAVVQAVIGRPLQGLRAALPGYGAFHVLRAEYPGLQRSRGLTTRGVLYRDVTPAELAVLDLFEGALYRRRRQIVRTENGQRVQAWTYMVAAGHHRQLTAVPWRLERFMRSQYPRFMRRFVVDRRAHYAPQQDGGFVPIHRPPRRR